MGEFSPAGLAGSTDSTDSTDSTGSTGPWLHVPGTADTALCRAGTARTVIPNLVKNIVMNIVKT